MNDTWSRAGSAWIPGSAARILGLGLSALLLACGGDSITGPQGGSCGPAPYFTVLPVPASDLALVTVFGGLGAPGHTLPTAHGGMVLTRENVALRSPGDLAVTDLRRVRYLSSPTRQGEEDYAIFFQVCRELTGWFGHVVTLSGTLAASSVEYDNCNTYSTSDETVEACEAKGLDIKVAAGDPLGTGGLSAARGFLAVDFGMVDSRVTNFYVSPHRYGVSHAVCMWEQFDAASQAVLFSKLRDPGRLHIVPTGEPRCGTMEVDVAGTAKGVWAETGVTGRVQGDERRYMTLADYPYRPQQELALSLGPESLGAHVAIVERRTAGRVNRAFEDVASDGQIYCYGPDLQYGERISWFLQMTSGSALRIERIDHGLDESPCNDDPATWAFGADVVSMVR